MGVTTLQFAEMCHEIISNDIFDEMRAESSVFHFAPNQGVSKFELLQLFKEVYYKDIKIKKKKAPMCIQRSLISRLEGISRLYQHNLPMGTAILKLKKFKS